MTGRHRWPLFLVGALWAVGFAFVGGEVYGQSGFGMSSPPMDTSGFATKADIPQPADTIPPSDTTPGSIGSAARFPRADATRPRITRTFTVTLDANGMATADWSSMGGPLPAPSCSPPSGVGCPVVVLEPIWNAGGVPKCWLTATPTTTQATLRCVVENSSNQTGALSLSLAIITQGININGGSASGMKVQVTALPPS